ncbi:hypothetical protein G6M50_30905 [Agrobacterium rhizogenes]|nr:hypothetical protein [Rhizobium rhizogenes]NTJ82200.1 hypothetical protein [Rhizobium rhizogenes]
MFYLAEYPDDPPGYVNLSTANEWDGWLVGIIPGSLHLDVRTRLRSNLKHILVGLEMKAALIVPHAMRVSGKSVLFESYYQLIIFEFCVGVFSVCEGLGSALWLHNSNNDGATAPQIGVKKWNPALIAAADPEGTASLDAKLETVIGVRDKIHQDRLGARQSIDWHAFSYQAAFIPAKEALNTLFTFAPASIPNTTNLRAVD